ncbi:ragB/SusD domain protein [Flavobacterium limnosediminis JC2902]|uniref:RagB/SusD domain protein n=1 Tax=Flavobacterium limnosediminis JC2902 TaxID=1341181 RepID=V6SHB5_9FLAO|nr:RagB/SusD family nutrient uptake outer membrane protein [Flavobacterium limnosediminis]ESU25976.1 ragB/SusD domain protein [Flavobacterium limnosediminis JC2902]
MNHHNISGNVASLKNNLIKQGLRLVCITLMGLLAACDSFVEVDLPPSQLTSPAVFENYTTATAAMVDIYARIRNNGLLAGTVTGVSNQMGNYTDELTFYGNSSLGTMNFYNNTLIASNTDISTMWNSSYSQIYATNAVIEGVTNSTTLSVAEKNQLLGEAYFTRALLHFYLLNLFGDIPYITTTDYRVNSIVSRMPSAEVYEHIKSDLLLSSSMVSEDYITSERVRPNKATVKALLARVYLYTGDWAAAVNEASEVINNTGLYVWENNLDNIFLKESTTTIWQLIPQSEGRNTEEGSTFIFTQGPPPVVALSNNLMTAFEVGDERKNLWTNAVTDGVDTWYHAYKYKQFSNTGTSQEYSIIFRLAEQYLIRAEALAQLGDLAGAKTDLNKIRNTAGLPDTVAVTQQDIITAIIQERRVEFFTELGHRFFDLKRTGNLDAALSGIKNGWNTTDRLLPLPESELLMNPNLNPQNPGY